MKSESQGSQKTALWGSKKCIIVYAGQYFDSETRLHYNYHRYYDPQLGRYLRADPIGLEGGINPYLYTDANPINIIDPDGLFFTTVDAYVAKYGPAALTGAATGFATDVAIQLATNGGNFECVDWGQAAESGAIGALFGVAFKAVAVTGELAGKAPIAIGRGAKRVQRFALDMGWEAYSSTAKTKMGTYIQNMIWMLKNVKGGRIVKDMGGNLRSWYYVSEKIIKYLWKPIW